MMTRKDLKLSVLVGWLIVGELLPGAALQQQASLIEITVVEEQSEGQQTGIQSEIFVMAEGQRGSAKSIGITDAKGKISFQPPVEWIIGERVFARPFALQLFFNSAEVRIPEAKLVLQVKRRTRRQIPGKLSQLQMLWDNADHASVNKQYGAVAHINADLAWYSDGVDPELAGEYRARAFDYTGRALEVDQPLLFDQGQNTWVMSINLMTAIKEYQTQSGIIPTGRLDSLTLSKLSGKPHYAFQYLSPSQVDAWQPVARITRTTQSPAQLLNTTLGLPNEVRSLTTNVQAAENDQDWALTGLLYNELLQRLKTPGTATLPPGLTDSIEAEIIEAVGKVLTVTNALVFDPVQAKFVASPVLTTKVAEYQTAQGQPPTGKLTYETLSALAGKDVGPYLVGPAPE